MLRERPLAQLPGSLRHGPDGIEADLVLLPLGLCVPACGHTLEVLAEVLTNLLECLAGDFELVRLVAVDGGVGVWACCCLSVSPLPGLPLALGLLLLVL